MNATDDPPGPPPDLPIVSSRPGCRRSASSRELADPTYSVEKLRSRGRERTLVARKLIFIEGDERVHFSEAGRRYAIELMAAGKSAEADAAGELDFNEARLLKLLLKRVIRATGQGLPEHWRKENIWRENNVWGAAGSGTEGSSTT